MNKIPWQVKLGAALIVLSVGLHYIHYLVFHDLHHIFVFLLADIAFIPLEVLLVSLVIHQLLDIHERRKQRKKMYMLLGAFFSEVGNEMLRLMAALDADPDTLRNGVRVGVRWTKKDYGDARKFLASRTPHARLDCAVLPLWNQYLRTRRQFTLNLLANPNVLDHEGFTDLLWAVLHLGEELAARQELEAVDGADGDHIRTDVNRVYHLLLQAWLDYMEHLQNDYPYLFSLAIRMDPLTAEPRAELST